MISEAISANGGEEMSLLNGKGLHFGDLVARLPIVQGGMGVGISMSGLASAVACEGGVGVISAACIGMFEPDFTKNGLEANIRRLRDEIRRARDLMRASLETKGLLGVNIMVALTNFGDMVRTSIEEGIDIIFSGAGLPLNLPEYLMGNKHTKLVPIVSSARAAGIIIKRWRDRFSRFPDAVVVEGPLAGGHLGFSPEQLEEERFQLDNLVPEVLKVTQSFEGEAGREIPVIAGGGIYTGADIARIMKAGASGVQLGTRFVVTDECDASDAFKQTYLDARKEDVVIVNSPVGMPGRAIRNEFLRQVGEGRKQPYSCAYHCISTCDLAKSPYCIASALIQAQKGNLKHGFAFAGSNVWRCDKITSVHELIEDLGEEYDEAAGPLHFTDEAGPSHSTDESGPSVPAS
jgi:nitronate monooxygenase